MTIASNVTCGKYDVLIDVEISYSVQCEIFQRWISGDKQYSGLTKYVVQQH